MSAPEAVAEEGGLSRRASRGGPRYPPRVRRVTQVHDYAGEPGERGGGAGEAAHSGSGIVRLSFCQRSVRDGLFFHF